MAAVQEPELNICNVSSENDVHNLSLIKQTISFPKHAVKCPWQGSHPATRATGGLARRVK
jgi:hypothetical protein